MKGILYWDKAFPSKMIKFWFHLVQIWTNLMIGIKSSESEEVKDHRIKRVPSPMIKLIIKGVYDMVWWSWFIFSLEIKFVSFILNLDWSLLF
jgi:hypothetical protein